MRSEAFSARRADGEILLVHLHRQTNDFRRQSEEGGVHVTKDRGRPFGQTSHLVQQADVIDQFQTLGGADGLGAFQHLGLAVLERQNDEVALQLGAVVGEVGDFERLARTHEAVAFGHVRRDDLAAFTTDGAAEVQRIGDHCAIKQGDDAVDRTNPAEAARAPTLGLRPRHGAEDGFQSFGHNLGRGAALLRNLRVIDAVTLDQLVLRQAGLSQEAFQRLSRSRGFGTFQLFVQVRRCHRQAFDHQRQAARAAIGGQAVPRQACLFKRVRRDAFQITRPALLHAGRDFFGEDFNKKLGHDQAFFASAAASSRRSCSTWAVAQALHRSRMRPI